MDDFVQSRDHTLGRLIELAGEVDFAAFVFAHDDWTTDRSPACEATEHPARRLRVTTWSSKRGCSAGFSACAGPSSSMHEARSFRVISSASRCVRYDEATTAAEMRIVNQTLRKAIEAEGAVARIEGLWWQFSLTERSEEFEPSAVSLLRISRDRDGGTRGGRPLVAGAGRRSPRDTGAKRRRRSGNPRGSSTAGRASGLGSPMRRSWKGRERSASSPRIARPDTSRRAPTGSRAASYPLTSGVYLRGNPEELSILDGRGTIGGAPN